MSQLRAVLRDQRGFTLTELLVVATVLGMILAGVVLIQMQGQQAYLFGSHRVEVQQNNRAALELITRELRSAQSVTTLDECDRPDLCRPERHDHSGTSSRARRSTASPGARRRR